MKKFLMTSVINEVKDIKLLKQWNDLRNALIEVGADPIVMNINSSYTTLSNAFILRNEVITKHAKGHPFVDFLQAHDFKTRTMQVDGRDLVLDKKHMWMGIGTNTSFDYKPSLDYFFEDMDQIVRPLLLTNKNFETLSSCFCKLDNGWLMWYPEAFHPHSRMIIESWYCDKIISVEETDALNGACNSISVDNALIMPNVSVRLREQLERLDLDIIRLDLSNLNNQAKSLVLEIL